MLLLSFITQAVTGLIFFFGIDVPNKHALLELHEYNGLLMAALVVIHVTLNWGWIKANILKKRG
ncbi:MAG: DUF4405 domain-containing protein [Candidatus Omnitrophota bacterium]